MWAIFVKSTYFKDEHGNLVKLKKKKKHSIAKK